MEKIRIYYKGSKSCLKHCRNVRLHTRIYKTYSRVRGIYRYMYVYVKATWMFGENISNVLKRAYTAVLWTSILLLTEQKQGLFWEKLIALYSNVSTLSYQSLFAVTVIWYTCSLWPQHGTVLPIHKMWARIENRTPVLHIMLVRKLDGRVSWRRVFKTRKAISLRLR